MFFHYSQNNSGGLFKYDEKDGISHHVVIEAETPDEADAVLESIGGYFNGCDLGYDCDCCGDRWDSADYGEAHDFPHVDGVRVEPHAVMAADASAFKFMTNKPEGFIHYASGEIEPFWKEKATVGAVLPIGGSKSTKQKPKQVKYRDGVAVD